MRYLTDTLYQDGHVNRLAHDYLNTHAHAALYDAFPPEKAHRLRQRFEFHSTPTHGSWMTMAEIEISTLAREYRSHACPDLAALRQRAAALEIGCNAA